MVVGEAADGTQALTLLACRQPDIVLLDYQMPGVGRLSTFCQELKHRTPVIRILVVSGFDTEDAVLEAAIGGVHGYFLKGSPFRELRDDIATVQRGGLWADPLLPPPVFQVFLCRARDGHKLGQLTRQELHVLALVAQDLTNKEIGKRLSVSRKTIKNHLTHIFAKLGVGNRRHAINYFLTPEC